MEISQKLLCFLFLASFAVGVAWGVLYDLFCLSRMLLGFPSGKLLPLVGYDKRTRIKRIFGFCLLFIEDFLFVLLGCIGLILLLYFINDGQFRFLAPLGLGCGFFVYHVTVGRLFMRVSAVLVRLIHRALGLLWRGVKFPIVLIGKGFFKIVVLPVKAYIKACRYRKSLRYTEKVLQDFKEAAGGCFGADAEHIN